MELLSLMALIHQGVKMMEHRVVPIQIVMIQRGMGTIKAQVSSLKTWLQWTHLRLAETMALPMQREYGNHLSAMVTTSKCLSN